MGVGMVFQNYERWYQPLGLRSMVVLYKHAPPAWVTMLNIILVDQTIWL